MTIAVTAASGKLGEAVVRALLEMNTGETIVGLARTPQKAQGLEIEIRPGDYDDPQQLCTSLKDVDSVLLVSGMAPPDVRVGQHQNVINAAKEGGVTKIVYTSVQGADGGTSFSPIIQSNRHTEADVRESGLDWVIGRNGIYIEPDVEYIESYKKAGEIANSAGAGRCGYTTRGELAYAYARMLTGTEHNGQTYRLHGEALTQAQLAEHLNMAFDTQLTYRAMSVEDYKADRIAELGEFIGTVISGIYQGIHDGAADQPSDYEKAAGRPHRTWEDYFGEIRSSR